MRDTSHKILCVLSQRPGETGSGVYVKELVGGLKSRSYLVHLAAADYKNLTTEDVPYLTGNELHSVVFSDGTNDGSSDIPFPIPGMSLDMPYLNLPFRNLTEIMLYDYVRVWTEKLQTIVSSFRPNIIHVNHLWLLPGIARRAAPQLPIIATAHGSEILLLRDNPPMGKHITEGVQKLDAIISVSAGLSDDISDIYGTHLPEIHVIENGYNSDLFKIFDASRGELRKQIQKKSAAPVPPEGAAVVLAVGKFAEYKGFQYLLRAASQYHEKRSKAFTWIIGNGSDINRKNLQLLRDSSGFSDRILMTGALPYEVMGVAMNCADVFVLSSLYEGFGLVLLEALACGKRCVAINIPSVASFLPRELVDSGYVSLVKPLGNSPDVFIRELQEAIVWQLDQESNPAIAKQISLYVKDMTWQRQIGRTARLYTDVVTSNGNQVATAI